MSSISSPFDLDNEALYQQWRAQRLARKPDLHTVVIEHSDAITEQEQQRIVRYCQQQGFALFRYQTPPVQPEAALRHLGHTFGLSDIDANLCSQDSGLSEITVKQTDTDNLYIPYTDRPIGWHTDGYYNPVGQEIHGMLLYCQQPAWQGGENGLLDHEIAYIRLRDRNPDWIRALMADNAFTIPANVEGGKQIRGATTGPVFALSNQGKNLHMRYSMRQRNVIWAEDPLTQEAAAFILQLLSSDDEHIIRLTMQPGQGVLCNNILHMRTRFTDAPQPEHKRVMYRARYHQRVGNDCH